MIPLPVVMLVFAGLTGVGVDAKGNLYVGGGFQGSDLRMFTSRR